jgi:hypothetical protein
VEQVVKDRLVVKDLWEILLKDPRDLEENQHMVYQEQQDRQTLVPQDLKTFKVLKDQKVSKGQLHQKVSKVTKVQLHQRVLVVIKDPLVQKDQEETKDLVEVKDQLEPRVAKVTPHKVPKDLRVRQSKDLKEVLVIHLQGLRVEQVVKDRLVVKDLSEILLKDLEDLQELALRDHRDHKVMHHQDQQVSLETMVDLVLQGLKGLKVTRV